MNMITCQTCGMTVKLGPEVECGCTIHTFSGGALRLMGYDG